MSRERLLICTSCAGAPDAAGRATLARALEAAGAAIVVAGQPCLNACGRPVTLALQGPGRATCLFVETRPEADRADLAATIRAWRAAPAGWIEDARPCGRLRFCLIGRVPALPEGGAG
ncbi:DUF1636 family protein [Roseivivax sp. CAU 1761]